MRLSVIYRGRALPLVWEVLGRARSSGAYERYEALLEAVLPLGPRGVKGVFLVERGVADTALLAHLRRLRWHFRIRSKAPFGSLVRGSRPARSKTFPSPPGARCFCPR